MADLKISEKMVLLEVKETGHPGDSRLRFSLCLSVVIGARAFCHEAFCFAMESSCPHGVPICSRVQGLHRTVGTALMS